MKSCFWRYFLWVALVLACVNFAGESDLAASKSKSHHGFYPNFDDNPHFSSKIRKEIAPYLLPLDHPAKFFLDHIFAYDNPIEDIDSLEAAGFVVVSSKTSSHVRVVKHRDLPGYLLKVYLNTISSRRVAEPGWKSFVWRCQGAENIRELIKKKDLQHFAVPDKWIYPLPVNHVQKHGHGGKGELVLLVVTDMELSSHSGQAWREKVTKRHLEELYCILSHGYASTFLRGNVPYTRSGKFACIDTEFPHRKNNYEKVYKYLSSKMKDYWDELLVDGGKI